MRYVYTTVGLLLLIGGLVAIKADQIGNLIAYGEAAQVAGPPPETVATATTDTQQLRDTLRAVGTVSSAQGVTISNEVAGVVTKIAFESGAQVRKGDVLVQLDTRVERAQLAQAKAQRRLASTSLQRTRQLVPSGAESASVLDADESSYATAQAEVRALQAQLQKKTIRAPFSGRLGIRSVDLGQYLNPGTALTVLETAEELYIDFTLPQERLVEVELGMAVELRLSDRADAPVIEGSIAAIDPNVDITTRSLKLRASVPEGDARLRPGMFVQVQVLLGEETPAVMVPATAVVHASYGDSVFVVEPKPEDEPGVRVTNDGLPVLVARQQFVKLGPPRGDFVSVVDGVEDGQEVVVAGAFKLRNGSPIVLDNESKPEPQLDPQVPNR